MKLLAILFSLLLLTLASPALSAEPGRGGDTTPSKKIEGFYVAGKGALEKGDLNRAEEMFLSMLELAPSDIRAYLGLGDMALARREYNEAQEFYQKALAIDRNNGKAMLGLGKVKFFVGDKREAFNFLQEALELNPDNAEAKRYITLLLGQSEQGRGSSQEYQKIYNSPVVTREEVAVLVTTLLGDFLRESNVSSPPQIATDVLESWAKESIFTVIRHNIMEIYPNHTFSPSTPVNREELARIIENLFLRTGVKIPQQAAGQGKKIEFPDLSSSNSYSRSILFVANLGIMGSNANGSFGVAESLSGRECMAILENVKGVLSRYLR
ncbi:MAG: tetratricopeptide repeat protein [Candidatus Tectomicrobia bacterium]|nr:tetratricopeptide repeat protein [Candidatus Tectomicrobia bacterium]